MSEETGKIASLKSSNAMTRRLALCLILATQYGSIPWVLGFSARVQMVQPKGSAATPTVKRKIAIVGAGGAIGATTFGFLQRACSLFGTGMGGSRCIGATAETAVRLNRMLTSTFGLAFVNESDIKLTNLASVEAITDRLEGWDAVILGSTLDLQTRAVTANTFETSPNQKTTEVYWNTVATVSEDLSGACTQTVERVLEAAKQARLGHIIVVSDDDAASSTMLQTKIKETGIPFTLIQVSGEVVKSPSSSYLGGVQGDLSIVEGGPDDVVQESSPIYREDLAALCVQCLQTLDWTRSRCLLVSSRGALNDIPDDPRGRKRTDQQWCINSYLLEDRLAGIA